MDVNIAKPRRNPSKTHRETIAQRAANLDAKKHPILAAYWPGLLTVNDDLVINDNGEARLSREFRNA